MYAMEELISQISDFLQTHIKYKVMSRHGFIFQLCHLGILWEIYLNFLGFLTYNAERITTASQNCCVEEIKEPAFNAFPCLHHWAFEGDDRDGNDEDDYDDINEKNDNIC